MSDRKKYYRNVKRLFPVHGKKEKAFLHEINEQIIEYENDHPHATYQEIVNQFGTPIDIVISYYQTIDSDYILRKMNIRKIIIIACSIVVCLAMIIALYFAFTIHDAKSEYDQSLNIHWEDQPIEIIEEHIIEE